jgi:predicted nucleic acid-binding protein
MSQQVFIDTDILIDFGQNNAEAVQTIAELERNYDFFVSVIVAMELYTGCRSKKDLANLDVFLSDFEIIFINKNISKQAFTWMRKYRASHGVEINDMLIAATAYSSNAAFISKNQKHYQFLPE